MRTTVTIDPDVEQLLRQAMQQTGEGFKTTLNRAIRQGLTEVASTDPEPPFVVQPQSLGLRAGFDPLKLQELGDEMEIDAFLSLTRRLQTGGTSAQATS
jgi:hypothetical protein